MTIKNNKFIKADGKRYSLNLMQQVYWFDCLRKVIKTKPKHAVSFIAASNVPETFNSNNQANQYIKQFDHVDTFL